MSDSSDDSLETKCHLQKELWKRLEKKFDKTKVLWSYFIELDEAYVKVPRGELIDLVLYTKSLRHILSCDECEVEILDEPLRLMRHRSSTSKK